MNGNGPTHGGCKVVFSAVTEGSSPCSRGLKCEAPFAWVPYPTQIISHCSGMKSNPSEAISASCYQALRFYACEARVGKS
jgi:hypothetical protein